MSIYAGTLSTTPMLVTLGTNPIGRSVVTCEKLGQSQTSSDQPAESATTTTILSNGYVCHKLCDYKNGTFIIPTHCSDQIVLATLDQKTIAFTETQSINLDQGADCAALSDDGCQFALLGYHGLISLH